MIEKDYNDFVNEMLEGVVFISDEEIARDTKSYKLSIAHTGKKVTAETRKKISKIHKGKKVSIETRKKLSSASKKISKESRKKMSNSHKGKKLSQETRKKMSKIRKGRKQTKEHVEKKSKLSFDIARQIRKEYHDYKEKYGTYGILIPLVKKFKVSKDTIGSIIRNESWKEEY